MKLRESTHMHGDIGSVIRLGLIAWYSIVKPERCDQEDSVAYLRFESITIVPQI
jgi:hypothetical protein